MGGGRKGDQELGETFPFVGSASLHGVGSSTFQGITCSSRTSVDRSGVLAKEPRRDGTKRRRGCSGLAKGGGKQEWKSSVCLQTGVTTTAAAHLNPDAFSPCALDTTMLPALSLTHTHTLTTPPSYQKFFIDEFHRNWETAKTWHENRKEERKGGKRPEELWLMRGWRGRRFRHKHGLYKEHWFQTANPSSSLSRPSNVKIANWAKITMRREEYK